MFSRRHLIEFACPTCTNAYGALPEKAGQHMTCTNCNTVIPIPVGIQPKLVTVGTSEARKLSPEELAVHHDAYRRKEAMLVRRTAPAELVHEDYDEMPRHPHPVARQDDDKKVKLNLGKWLGMEVDVDGKTRNAMATTFLGGLLVAIGAIIAAKFGFKSRS